MPVRVAVVVAVLVSALASLVEAPGVRADSTDEATLSAALSAREIVPNPGPEGGSGTAALTSDADEKSLCYDLHYQGISPPTSGLIRRAPAGMNGPVELDLEVARQGDKGCVKGDGSTLRAIGANPAGHYVVLTTREYPEGAIRGQLRREG